MKKMLKQYSQIIDHNISTTCNIKNIWKGNFYETHEYFTKQKLFKKSQYGFRNEHSTEYAA